MSQLFSPKIASSKLEETMAHLLGALFDNASSPVRLSAQWQKLDIKKIEAPHYQSQYFFSPQSLELVKAVKTTNVLAQSVEYRLYVVHPKSHYKNSYRSKAVKELFSIKSLNQKTSEDLENDWFKDTRFSLCLSMTKMGSGNFSSLNFINTLQPTQRPNLSQHKLGLPQQDIPQKNISHDFEKSMLGVKDKKIYQYALTSLNWASVELLFGLFDLHQTIEAGVLSTILEQEKQVVEREENYFNQKQTDILLLCSLDMMLQKIKQDVPERYIEIVPEDDTYTSLLSAHGVKEGFFMPYAFNVLLFIKDDAASWRGFALGENQRVKDINLLIENKFDKKYLNFQIVNAKINLFDAEIVKCEPHFLQELEELYSDKNLAKVFKKTKDNLLIEITKFFLEETLAVEEIPLAQKTHSTHKI